MSMQVDQLISNVFDTIHQKQEEKITQMNISRLAAPLRPGNPTTEMVNR